MDYKSEIIEKAVKEISFLPGIGERSALRLVIHLLRQPKKRIDNLSKAIFDISNVTYCNVCNNISEKYECEICSSDHRDKSIVCVVEDVRDLLAIENTKEYKGVYHVLGGRISPMEGISVEDLKIEELEKKINEGRIKEIFLALSSTLEGDTTSFYLYKKFLNCNVKITSIARGISLGNEIEYIDEATLAKSIYNRVLYESII